MVGWYGGGGGANPIRKRLWYYTCRKLILLAVEFTTDSVSTEIRPIACSELRNRTAAERVAAHTPAKTMDQGSEQVTNAHGPGGLPLARRAP